MLSKALALLALAAFAMAEVVVLGDSTLDAAVKDNKVRSISAVSGQAGKPSHASWSSPACARA